MEKGYHKRQELTMSELGLSLEELAGQPLELFAREGAKLLLTVALEEEVTDHLMRRPYERSQGKVLGYRNGRRERQVSCGAGEIEIAVPRVSDTEETFRSQLLEVWQRPYAIRKPRDYGISQVGDLVQLDTLDIRPLPGVSLKHFTAHDVVSRWNIVSVYNRATATTASLFLDTLAKRMPFPVKAIQVDGGSEFEAIFEEECQRRGIKLFVLPPRSPKLNGAVERAHRTHTEEFYEVTESSFDLSELRNELLEWERVYNTVRPHQALGYVTPLKFLEQWKQYPRKEEVSLII